MRETKINVIQDENAPIQLDVLAASIIAVSEGVKKLRATALKDDALYLLIQHAAPSVRNHSNGNTRALKISEIKAVFAGIESLRQTYLKPNEKAREKG